MCTLETSWNGIDGCFVDDCIKTVHSGVNVRETVGIEGGEMHFGIFSETCPVSLFVVCSGLTVGSVLSRRWRFWSQSDEDW